MVIKYCPNCIGAPYTRNIRMETCPICGTELETEVVSKESLLKKRMMLKDVDAAEYSGDSHSFTKRNHEEATDETGEVEIGPKRNSHLSVYPMSRARNGHSIPSIRSNNAITGRVINYRCSSDEGGQYRRPFLQKLYEYIVYGQKTEDVLHRFSLYDERSDSLGYSKAKKTPVNVHGNILNGLSIQDGSEVEVRGKFNSNHVFMAKDIYIKDYGSNTKVYFKHDPRFISDFVFMIVALFLMFITATHYEGGFFDGIGSFIKTWIFMIIVFCILYLFLFAKLLMFSVLMGKGKFSISGVVFLSFIATLVYMNRHAIWASTGSAVMSFLQSVIVTIIFGAIIIYLIKALIGF